MPKQKRLRDFSPEPLRKNYQNLLWPWGWCPLAFLLSTFLLLPLAAFSCSRRSASWLPAGLTIGPLSLFSSALRFAMTRRGGRRGWRFIDSRLTSLFSASPFARSCTRRWWLTRLAVASSGRLSSLCTATLTHTGAGWQWCPAPLSSESFAATLIWWVRRTTGLSRFRGRGEPVLWLTVFRWWRRWTE
jgi:hypothetical protein